MSAVVRGIAAFAVLLLTVPSPARADTPGGSGSSSSGGANVGNQDDEAPVCGQVPTDHVQMKLVRSLAEEKCDCAGVDNHGKYLLCVFRFMRAAVKAGKLRKECFDKVIKCESKSTCGLKGAVTCCLTSAQGVSRCALRPSAGACKPFPGGTACVTEHPSCCDACGPKGCFPSSTTTTLVPPSTTSTTAPPSTTTTTIQGPVCGNGVVEPGEQCDPPGSATCPSGSPGGALLDCLEGCVCPGPSTTSSSTTTTSTTATTATTTTSTTETTATTASTTSSTTVTTTSTTSTTQGGPVCGNGVVEPGEQCDPPGSATCPSGSPGGALLDCLAGCVCPPVPTTTTLATTTTSTTATTETTATTTTSTTVTTATTATTTTSTTSTTATTATTTTSTTATTTTTLCSCCPGPNSLIRFTNGIGSGTCGSVSDASNTPLFDLQCGGLYTGGGASTLSNPAAPPDMGTEYVRPSACSGTSYTILPTVPGDLTSVGGTHRNCTSAGVADPDYPACAGGTNVGRPCVVDADCPSSTCTSTMPGCLFGAPLAIPNPNFTGASVCVVNRVQTSASGSGDCQTGATALNLPLASDLYLTGDLLDGSAPDRPNVAGINPCPICDPTTNLCQGGPRHGMSCHPDTSMLSAAYPTSHDCPPPPGPLGSNYIGALPIPFNLTTGTQTSTANNTNLTGQEVFCGFCGATFSPTFHNPPVPCANDAACTGVTGCPGTVACARCKQRDSGAFALGPAPGSEHVISVTGSAAGVCLADGAPHAATLASAFCIPPAYNATVDANGDLPGPGAVSLPGQSQLVP